MEDKGALSPFQSKFIASELVSKTTPPPASTLSTGSTVSSSTSDSTGKNEISWLPYEQLQARLKLQREKPTRLPILEWDAIASKLPDGLMDKPSDIIWYRIAFGYASVAATTV